MKFGEIMLYGSRRFDLTRVLTIQADKITVPIFWRSTFQRRIANIASGK